MPTKPTTKKHDQSDHDHADHDHSKHTSSPMIAENTVLPLKIAWSEVEPVYKKSVTKYAQKIKIDGFRKGHVPAPIAEEYLKPDTIVEDTARQLVPDRVPQLLKSANVTPISQPEVQIKSAEKGSDWVLEVIVAEKPVIDVKNYKSIVKAAKKEAATAWEKQQAELKKQEKSQAKEAATTQPSGKENQTKTAEDLATKEKDMTMQTIYAALVTQLKPQIPELLIRQQVREELENLVRQLQGMKMTLDDFLAKSHQSFDDLSGNMAARVLGQLQLAFVLQAIATEAKLTVTEAEIDTEIEKQVEPQQFAVTKQNPRARSYVQEHLMQEKVKEHLLQIK